MWFLQMKCIKKLIDFFNKFSNYFKNKTNDITKNTIPKTNVNLLMNSSSLLCSYNLFDDLLQLFFFREYYYCKYPAELYVFL